MKVGKGDKNDKNVSIDYCDEHVIQERSYIFGTICLTHTYYISYEPQYLSLLDHTSKNEIRHRFPKR